MKIARVILDIGAPKKDMDNYSSPWIALKTILLSDFKENTNLYKNRIKNLIEKCLQENVDVILLPACTLIYGQENPLSSYLNTLKNTTTLISGTLNNLPLDNKNLPVRLIINNEYFRIIEISLRSHKKVYASLENPSLHKMRTGKRNSREFKIMSHSPDLIEILPEWEMNEAGLLINEYAYSLDYSNNVITTDEAIAKLRNLRIAKEDRFKVIKKHSSSTIKKASLFDSKEKIIDNFVENIVIVRQNSVLERFNADIVKWLQIKNISAMVAISSTIKHIYKDFSKVKISDNYPPANNTQVIAFDVGHHQYSGRYKGSLKKVVSTLQKDYGYGLIFLSYWKYMNSNSQDLWIEPSNLIEHYKREIVNSDTKKDAIDICNI